MIFGIDTAIVIAIIGFIGSLSASYVVKKANEKFNRASAKKINAEADQLIYNFQSKVITDLQDQIDILKKDIQEMRNQEYIHLQEKIRLEEKIIILTNENFKLKQKLDVSSEEISKLTNQLNIMKKDLAKLKSKNA